MTLRCVAERDTNTRCKSGGDADRLTTWGKKRQRQPIARELLKYSRGSTLD
jgi:hypothetical protein